MKGRLFFLKDMWSSRLSLIGVTLTTVAAVLILLSLLLDLFGGGGASSYRGLIAYALMPAVFVIGLILIPIGVWRVRRRGGAAAPLIIDLGRKETRRRLAFILVLTAFNSVILSFALYQGYHYTDSNQFCGLLCHTVMKPEYSAYRRSPHARVACVQCHIGVGASWYIRSKLSGLRQVWAVLTKTYHRPIPTPVENLRPARETCEECHWPQVFHGNQIRTWRRPADDPASTDNLVTALNLHIGGLNSRTGRYEGIHWHVSASLRVEYLAGDAGRLQIRRVRVTDEKGETQDFIRPDLPEPPAGSAWRTMDCVDCHNRPTHRFEDPQAALDESLLAGRIDRALPNIRAVALEALAADYPSAEAAQAGIAARLDDTYRQTGQDMPKSRAAALSGAGREIAAIWERNVFPEMMIGFGTYPVHIGHRDERYGCFRCHDESHAASSGKTISQDCGLCHELLAQEESEKSLSSEIRALLR